MKSYLQVPLVGRSALVSVSTVAGAWVKYHVPRLQSDNCSPFEKHTLPRVTRAGKEERRRGESFMLFSQQAAVVVRVGAAAEKQRYQPRVSDVACSVRATGGSCSIMYSTIGGYSIRGLHERRRKKCSGRPPWISPEMVPGCSLASRATM